jgi:hypothetical protein
MILCLWTRYSHSLLYQVPIHLLLSWMHNLQSVISLTTSSILKRSTLPSSLISLKPFTLRERLLLSTFLLNSNWSIPSQRHMDLWCIITLWSYFTSREFKVYPTYIFLQYFYFTHFIWRSTIWFINPIVLQYHRIILQDIMYLWIRLFKC